MLATAVQTREASQISHWQKKHMQGFEDCKKRSRGASRGEKQSSALLSIVDPMVSLYYAPKVKYLTP